MNEKDFVALCKKQVAEYVNEHLDKADGKQITEDEEEYEEMEEELDKEVPVETEE